MYFPSAFEEKDRGKPFDFLEAYSFGLLVSLHGGEPFASHLPFLLERGVGPHGALLGHMARANPQWHDLDRKEVLVVLSGPHAYVSPTWYESDHVVPTWNYVAVHASGTFCLVQDAVDDLVAGQRTRTESEGVASALLQRVIPGDKQQGFVRSGAPFVSPSE